MERVFCAEKLISGNFVVKSGFGLRLGFRLRFGFRLRLILLSMVIVGSLETMAAQGRPHTGQTVCHHWPHSLLHGDVPAAAHGHPPGGALWRHRWEGDPGRRAHVPAQNVVRNILILETGIPLRTLIEFVEGDET